MSFLTQYFYFIGSLIFTGYLINAGQSLVSPLLAAWILALALKPFAAWLERIKLPRFISTLITVMLSMAVLFILLILFYINVSNIDFELSKIVSNLNETPLMIQTWVHNIFGLTPEQQTSILRDGFVTVVKNSSALINHTLSFTTSFLTSFGIFVFSLFFVLYYRTLFVDFLYNTISSKFHRRLKTILKKLQEVISSYVLGLVFIMLIVAMLNSFGLWLLGIEHAVLFGVIASVLTLIPYLGLLIGSLLPAVYVLLTTGSITYAGMVIVVFMIVQFIEGNFLTPNIVGRQISVNPFAAILALIIGGLLLGIIGIMFALPVLAIFKIIFDEIPTLRSLGSLIGKT